ncbi:unnamed protein product, partial [Mesorhabditis spiculigera]
MIGRNLLVIATLLLMPEPTQSLARWISPDTEFRRAQETRNWGFTLVFSKLKFDPLRSNTGAKIRFYVAASTTWARPTFLGEYSDDKGWDGAPDVRFVIDRFRGRPIYEQYKRGLPLKLLADHDGQGVEEGFFNFTEEQMPFEWNGKYGGLRGRINQDCMGYPRREFLCHSTCKQPHCRGDPVLSLWIDWVYSSDIMPLLFVSDPEKRHRERRESVSIFTGILFLLVLLFAALTVYSYRKRLAKKYRKRKERKDKRLQVKAATRLGHDKCATPTGVTIEKSEDAPQIANKGCCAIRKTKASPSDPKATSKAASTTSPNDVVRDESSVPTTGQQTGAAVEVAKKTPKAFWKGIWAVKKSKESRTKKNQPPEPKALSKSKSTIPNLVGRGESSVPTTGQQTGAAAEAPKKKFLKGICVPKKRKESKESNSKKGLTKSKTASTPKSLPGGDGATRPVAAGPFDCNVDHKESDDRLVNGCDAPGIVQMNYA